MAPKATAQAAREMAARAKAQQILESAVEFLAMRHGYNWRRTAPSLTLTDFRVPGFFFALELRLSRVGQRAFIEVRRYGKTIARSAFFDERTPVELAKDFRPLITLA